MFLRELAKRFILTFNTARYTVETPRVQDALRLVGPVDTLLDAGAGGGHYATHCYLPVCRQLVAVEYEARNFQILQRSLAPYGDRAQALQGSVTEIPLPDASVDCVACTQVMEHIADDGQVADEFARVLRGRGYILVTVPQPPAPWPEGDHVRDGYQLADLDALLVPRGFERIHADWFLTLDSQRICHTIVRWGGRAPRIFRFKETRETVAQRREQQPYGLLALYRKRPNG